MLVANCFACHVISPNLSQVKTMANYGKPEIKLINYWRERKTVFSMAISLQTRCLQKTKKSKQTEFNKLKSKQSRRPEKLRGILLLQESIRNAELYHILPSTLEILSQKKKRKRSKKLNFQKFGWNWYEIASKADLSAETPFCSHYFPFLHQERKEKDDL